MTKEFKTILVDYTSTPDLITQVRRELSDIAAVEIRFKSLPHPLKFREAVVELAKEFPKERVFLGEKEGVFAGVLFNINLSRPRRAVIEIANGCNLKCDFCWSHSPLLEKPPDPKWLKKTLDSKTIYTYLDELADYGTVRLVEFCAIGDPLYHPEIWDLIRYAKQKGFRLRLSTNGTLLLPQKWEENCQDPVDELFMNISAGDRNTYADIHNVSPKIFDQLMANLNFLNSTRKQKSQKFEMRWINIVTDKNLPNIGQIVQRAKESGANYLDFRYVWIHQNFQKNIGVSRAGLERNERDLDGVRTQLNEAGIPSNFESFYNAVKMGEA